jgi:uncharacterized membrane protein
VLPSRVACAGARAASAGTTAGIHVEEREITKIEAVVPHLERAGAAVAAVASPADLRITAVPNRALSTGQRVLVAVAMTVPVAVVALFVAAHGGWLVLPFAGLEIAVIWAAHRWLRAHDDDYERVQVSGDRVTLERCIGRRFARAELNRAWVGVVYEPAGFARKGELALCSHGRSHPVGELMTEDERASAARQLAMAVGRPALRR